MLRQIRVFVLAFAVAAPLLPAQAGAAEGESISPAAREHFKAGVSYLEDPDGQRFEDAYAEFKAAYALSHSPKILGNLGLCAMKLERDGEAIDAYSRYLAEVSSIDPDERAQISRDLETLRAGASHVALTVDGPAAMIQDTRIPVRGPSITNIYGPITGTLDLTLRPGHHQIRVTGESPARPVWEFNIGAGQRLAHEFEPPPPPSARRHGPSMFAPWATAAIGAGAITAGGIMGLLTMNKVRAIEQKCPSNACPPGSGFESDVQSARTYVTITDGLLLGGAVLTATGLTWVLIASSSARESAFSAAPQAATFGGACSATGCVATVGGTFR